MGNDNVVIDPKRKRVDDGMIAGNDGNDGIDGGLNNQKDIEPKNLQMAGPVVRSKSAWIIRFAYISSGERAIILRCLIVNDKNQYSRRNINQRKKIRKLSIRQREETLTREFSIFHFKKF